MKQKRKDYEGIFFGDTEAKPISKERGEKLNLPKSIALEIAELLYDWSREARGRLPDDLQSWAGKHPDKPDWLDLNSIDHCWHLIALVGHSLPTFTAPSPNLLDAEQRDAAELLLRCQRACTAIAAFGKDKELALALFGASIDLGVKASEATTRPYEKSAFTALKSTQGLNDSNTGSPEGSANDERRKASAEWKSFVFTIARELVIEHPKITNSALARKIYRGYAKAADKHFGISSDNRKSEMDAVSEWRYPRFIPSEKSIQNYLSTIR